MFFFFYKKNIANKSDINYETGILCCHPAEVSKDETKTVMLGERENDKLIYKRKIVKIMIKAKNVIKKYVNIVPNSNLVQAIVEN